MRKNGHKQIKSIKDLQPDVLNANKGTPRGLQMVEDSLRTYGAGRSILADKQGRIIAGNKTLQSAADIDLPIRVVETDGKELVVVQRTDLDLNSKKARELGIADNRSSEVGLEWDADILAQLKDKGVELSGMFTEKELAALLPQGESKDAEPQIDKAAELQQKWQVVTGEIIQIGRHRLMCGDSTEKADVGRVCAGNRVQAVVTSPPYGVGMEYEGAPDESATVKLLQAVFTNWCGVVSPNGFAFVNFGERYIWSMPMTQVYFDMFAAMSWRWYDQRFWKRSNVGMAIWNTTQPRAMSQVEYLFTFQNGKKIYPVHDLSVSKEQLWDDEGSSAGAGHQAVMALGVAEKAITIYSQHGDAVGEPFAGSGTTLVAAENLNRTCYAMEISPEYCAVTLERMTTAFPHLEIKREEAAIAA